MSNNGDISARLSCFRILKRAYADSAFLNLELKGADDFVRAAVYGTVTYTYTIDFLIKHIGGRDVSGLDIDTLTLLRFGIWQLLFSDKVPSYAATATTVDLGRKVCPRSAGLINAILRKISDSPEDKKDPDSYKPEVALSLKSEIYGVLKKSYGKDRAYDIGKALLHSSPLTVRYNRLKTDKESLVSSLQYEGFQAEYGMFCDDALILRKTGDTPLDKTKAFINGEFFVQSESAMLASIVSAPQKGYKILDCCSAPGGKASHMAELTGDDADITASDINPARLDLICQNTRRLGITSVKTVEADATCELPDETYDIVTTDVPCSGLGLLGKKPDIRLNLDYQGILSLIGLQSKITDEASKRVSPGGVLIYSTCTLNRAENEDAVSRFLDSHDDFYAEDINGYLPEKIIMDSKREEDARNGYITLFPDIDGSDGFFIARLRRRR
ncbi:MAG: 16S rRNA (cytosine(967)-C(5))-methyltransferase RsmB [Clostridiales bacterium]|nr:16S rRNA (cytosine(967)-C(5))-methyltransferase RsmB [Clostridiales bacterium]